MAKVLQSFTLYCSRIIRGQRLSKTVFSDGVGDFKSHGKCCASFVSMSLVVGVNLTMESLAQCSQTSSLKLSFLLLL